MNQWLELKHTDLIDDFLDSLTNLMWRTGYTDEVAKDILIRGLNQEVGLAWAQIPQKPCSLHEQMALIRDIGHNLENFKVLNKTHRPITRTRLRDLVRKTTNVGIRKEVFLSVVLTERRRQLS